MPPASPWMPTSLTSVSVATMSTKIPSASLPVVDRNGSEIYEDDIVCIIDALYKLLLWCITNKHLKV